MVQRQESYSRYMTFNVISTSKLVKNYSFSQKVEKNWEHFLFQLKINKCIITNILRLIEEPKLICDRFTTFNVFFTDSDV